MKAIFYFGLKYFLRVYNRIYFRSIKIYGLKNIPKDGGVLYSPNHQGAFLDPLLIGSMTPGRVTSLTRSDVFGGPLQWFLDALQMLPIYRIRNGYSNLKKNDEIFDQCYDLLGNGKNLMMFSEGGHHNEYYLQRLSKGSSRLVFQAHQKYPQQKIYIQPVGINYGHHQQARCSLHLVFGEAIEVGQFINSQLSDPENINALRDQLQERMEDCLWLPDNGEHYALQKDRINRITTQMDFYSLKSSLHSHWEKLPKRREIEFLKKLMAFCLLIPSFPPMLTCRWVIGKFEDIVFISSLKYAFGAFLFPLWWLISGSIIAAYFSLPIALTFIGVSMLFLLMRSFLLLK